MRVLSNPALRGAFSQQTGEVYLIILRIDHEDLASPIYVVNNTENITSNGDEYIGCGFEINLPSDTGEEIVRITLTIQNVDRKIVEAVRSCDSEPTVELEVILASSPDTIEAGPYYFTLLNANYDHLIVAGELGYEDILNEPYPGNRFSPAEYPGLY